jgi:hypothetical protein
MNLASRCLGGALVVLAWSVPAQVARAAEPVNFCVKNVEGSEAHFSVHYKQDNQILKNDSGQFGKGKEKCIEVPADATDIELAVYKSRFIVWAQACKKTWPTLPEAAVHVDVSGSTFGVKCDGL